ncbi:4Fe-4S ferredoxin N-terminal domain-containing protein [Halalkalirubrum salinum]|uniref:4Fe-4S ferredoxin N-terminal domain-containing protein n=1 Tax=Halalkalirubrum salinum TaxID=2563889 RepID=UPI0010FBB09A|nr:4Fe-4S ferredoxin N-terminal domain-containing protein [Halalkalirubrum salinum]
MSNPTDQSGRQIRDEAGLNPLELVDDLADAPDDSEYDQELGRRMGIDAMRVANGELDEREFHEKYEEELLVEFGDDYSPAAVMRDE